jgi:hypothetical protein
MKVTWASKEEVDALVRELVAQTQVVLDIGPGIRPQTYFRPRVHICVEPYLPYIEQLRKVVADDPIYVFLNCTWDTAMKLLPSKSVDSVIALDVIEHFEKFAGFEFLEQAERVARRQIVIYTPLDFYPQTYHDSNRVDRWGMEGGYWQAHRSGWLPEDFGDGWELICCEAYHFVDQYEQPLDRPFGAIWGFRNLKTKEPKTKTMHMSRNIGSLIFTSLQILWRSPW